MIFVTFEKRWLNQSAGSPSGPTNAINPTTKSRLFNRAWMSLLGASEMAPVESEGRHASALSTAPVPQRLQKLSLSPTLWPQ